MSFKAQVVQDGPNKFVLPRIKTMKVEAVAFLSPDLYAKSEEELWRQAFESASYEGVTGVYLMPDTHMGYGIPVGGVVVTDGTIIQSGSGYDISCGVVYMQVPGLHASDIADPATRRRWIDEVELRIATGVGAAPTEMMKSVSSRKMDEILRHGAAAPAPIAPEKPIYNPTVAKTGEAKLVKPVAIHFDTGQHALDAGAMSILRKDVLTQLQLAQGMYVRVEGNTDDVGSDALNTTLSGRRASSVAEFLVQQGVDQSRIASKGNGESNPVCNLKTEDCRALNRRTDIIFVSAQ